MSLKFSNSSPKSKKSKKKSSKKQKYSKLTEIEHVLKRPSMYIGPCDFSRVEKWSVDFDSLKAVFKEIEENEGMIRTYLEVLYNAFDNVKRSLDQGIEPGIIRITVENNVISIYNEGITISTKTHKETGLRIPRLIFGELRSSSNYNDEEERNGIGGTNGLGVKLTNIFSKEFSIELFDSERGDIYKQTWKNNMSECSDPVEEKHNGDTGYTKVTWTLDFERFHCKKYSQDIKDIFLYHAMNVAFTAKVPVYFNERLLDYDSVEKYIASYIDIPENSEELNYVIHKDANSEVCLVDAPFNGFQISFVNGVNTENHGIHVDTWLKALSAKVLETFNKKGKKGEYVSGKKVTVTDLRRHLVLIVNCNLDKPLFDSQSKTKLKKPAPSTSELSEKDLKEITKWKFVTAITDEISAKSDKKLGKNKIYNIKGLTEANNAGKEGEAEKCGIIAIEGKSAAQFAAAFIACVPNGTDYFGYIPLRGKVLNILNASAHQKLNNKELISIRNVTGVRVGVDYENPDNRTDLRYGSFYVMTDADVDGFHIKALLMLYFGESYTSLLKIGYFKGIVLPLYMATKKGKAKKANSKADRESKKLFFTKAHFEKFKKSEGDNISKWEIDYHKGLGSIDKNDEQLFFDNRVIVVFQYDEQAASKLRLVFLASNRDLRKTWLAEGLPTDDIFTSKQLKSLDEPGTVVEDDDEAGASVLLDQGRTIDVNCSDYLDKRQREFSLDDLGRSIPGPDGLKPVQRDIIYTMLYSAAHKDFLKVDGHAGGVITNTCYHHGQTSMIDTIAGMAQDFPTSNNCPLIEGKGQFGSRDEPAPASARYTRCKLAPISRLLFRKEDIPILQEKFDEDKMTGYKFFLPIIPNDVLNGTIGIGTGYSCAIPPYRPRDLANWFKAWLKINRPAAQQTSSAPPAGSADAAVDDVDFPELIPWYRGYTGDIEVVNGKVYSYGVFDVKKSRGSKKQVTISELPVAVSGSSYREYLKYMIREKTGRISGFTNHCKKNKIGFKLTGVSKPTLDRLKLKKAIKRVITIIREDGTPKRFKTVQKRLANYAQLRYDGYVRRISYDIKTLEKDIVSANLKIRFIADVIAKAKPIVKELVDIKPVHLPISELEKDELEEEMKKRGYPLEFLRLHIGSLTPDSIRKLLKEVDQSTNKLKNLKNTTPGEIWSEELNEFVEAYEKLFKDDLKEEKKIDKIRAKRLKTIKSYEDSTDDEKKPKTISFEEQELSEVEKTDQEDNGLLFEESKSDDE